MNRHEEDLQRNFDAGIEPVGDEVDIQAYREVFSRLKKVHKVELSPDFADTIVARVIERKEKEASRDILWFGAGAFLLAAACAIVVVMSGFKLQFGFLKNISSYAGLFVFGAFFIILLLFLEKRIIPRRDPFGDTKKI